MTPKQQSYDPAWRHARRLENRFHWQCLHCDMIGRGGGITRLKQHLAGGYPDVSKCPKVPQEVRRAMKEELDGKKTMKYKQQQQRELLDSRSSKEPTYDEFESRDEVPNDEEFLAALHASRTEYEYEQHMRHGGTIVGAGGSGSAGASGSGSTTAATLGRSASARITSTQGGIGRFFSSMGRRRAVDVADIDPLAFPDQASKQTRIDDAYTKEKKKSIGKSIAKFFHFNQIPPNAANNTYYRSMVSNIQKSGPGIQPPTAYEIAGPYLDEQVEEIKTWILSCKKQWSLYGITLMCDGWTGPTRMSIINFLIYCNRKVIFHKSIDATTDYHDAPYIYRLMDNVVQDIGAEHIVQVITDNGANFKRAGELLEQKHQTLFWTPCAAHCIDLMMADIGKLDIVKKIVKKVEPLYVVLRKVDMDKKPQMGNVYRLIYEAKEEIKRRLQSPTKYQPYIDIITARWDNQMGKYIHLAGYYLNPAYQYRYNLGTNEDLLAALRNVISRLQPNRQLATEAINESRLFREAYGSFSDDFAVSCRYKMDAAEWWLQFGGSTPNLKKIAVRILSQTTSSSGCERNWTTFSLIHTKVRNRLSYRRLEKMVYVHYNMRLQLRAITEEKEEQESGDVDPFDIGFVQTENDPMMDWWSAVEAENPLLDEAGDPPRPSEFLTQQIENMQTRGDIDEEEDDDDQDFRFSGSRPRRSQTSQPQTQPKSVDKGKGKAPATFTKEKRKVKTPTFKERGQLRIRENPLEAIDEQEHDDSDETSSPSDTVVRREIRNDDSDVDSSASTHGSDNSGDASGGGETYVPSTPAPEPWTCEQDYTHATQDDDHGGRTIMTQYRRRSKVDKQKEAHNYQDMRESLAEIDSDRSSSYSRPSYYSSDASYGDPSYQSSGAYAYPYPVPVPVPIPVVPVQVQLPVVNRDMLMDMWRNQYQYCMSWDDYLIWALENYGVDLSRMLQEPMLPSDSRHSFWY
ncbi:uncharacterized protein LOC141843279 [Curcuma longa]|uniref:uncharacterized protein LOC141843279 n=1 Tax=Curcuma longa TaxID=136217 RepID=UPI003D9E820B